ncbi:hypothetical protein D9M72_548640 [compost metagenome]
MGLAGGGGGVKGVALVFLDIALEHALFIGVEPRCLVNAVAQHEDRHHADHERGQRLDQEHPLPAAQIVHAVERIHDPARQRVAEHACNGDARHEQRDHLAAAVGREPVGQVQDHAGVEARFG